MTFSTADTDIALSRWKNGFKLSRVTDTPTLPGSTPLSVVMAQPFNVFFTNEASAFSNINESTTDTCGCDSPFAARGKKAIDFFDSHNANIIEEYNSAVLKKQCRSMHDYDLQRKDGSIKHVLTFRAPLYSNDGKVVGITGSSIAVGEHPLAESLATIHALGFMVAESHQPQGAITVGDVYLSSKEKLCLQYAVRGKTMREIAIILGLSRRTVEHYLENIKRKFNVKTKPELIERAIDLF